MARILRRVFLPSSPSLGNRDFAAKLNSRILIPIQPGGRRLSKWVTRGRERSHFTSPPPIKITGEGEKEGKAGGVARAAGRGGGGKGRVTAADRTVAPAESGVAAVALRSGCAIWGQMRRGRRSAAGQGLSTADRERTPSLAGPRETD